MGRTYSALLLYLLLSPNRACLCLGAMTCARMSLPDSLSGNVAHRMRWSNDGGCEMNDAVPQGVEWLSRTVLGLHRTLWDV